MTDVTEFQALDFIKSLPSWVTARVGEVDAQWYFVLETDVSLIFKEEESHILHCDVGLKHISEENCKLMLANLGSAVFEAKFPGKFLELVRKRAELAQVEKDLSFSDEVLWDMFQRLTHGREDCHLGL